MSLNLFLKLLGGSQDSDSEEIIKAVGMQAIASEMQLVNTLTARISNKLLNDVIDDVFSIKRRHKVTHV